MTKSKKLLSEKRIERIKEQGYRGYTDIQIRDLAFGNRFAARLNVAFLVPAVIFANLPLLIFMNVVAVASIFLPNHPFDYSYNQLICRWTQGPKVPPRSAQVKFAGIMASLGIAATIYFFASGMMMAGYIMGFQLLGIALLVSLIDLCFLAKIYNFLAGKLKRLPA